MRPKISRKSAIIIWYLLTGILIVSCGYQIYEQFAKNNIILGWVLTIITISAFIFLCYVFHLAIKINKPQPPKESLP